MTEDSRFSGSSGTPAGSDGADQDFGFFTSAPAAAPTQFGPPPAPLAPPVPYGPPPAYGQPPYPPVQRSGLPVWAIVAICVPAALVVLGILAAIAIPVFLNQRSKPVMPASIRGVPRSTDTNLTDTATQIRDRMSRENPHSLTDAASYGTAKSGYVLVGANLRINPSQEFGDLASTGGLMSFGATQCATNAQSHVSLCVHTGTRGSVELVALGGSDLAQLAADTDKAWSAQPFGHK
jgi:hypothetical protein